MDFGDTPDEAAFPRRGAAWPGRAPDRRVRRAGSSGGPAERDGLGRPDRVGANYSAPTAGSVCLAGGVRRPRAHVRAAGDLRGGVRTGQCSGADLVLRRGPFAPTLIQFGTDEQKRRFLPKIQSVEELWCQGFSEPNAGSDLANIQTRAVLDGDEWVITGQKVWTTLAHRADWCFVVCRTDPESKSHHGLSYLLCPVQQPGVEVRPLRQMTGSSEFNEVFFDGARTAKENVLGPVGEGWKVGWRRSGSSAYRVPLAATRVRARVQRAARRRAQARRFERPRCCETRWPTVTSACRSCASTGLRMLTSMLKNGGSVGPEASIGKLFWTTWHRGWRDGNGRDRYRRAPRRAGRARQL